MCKCKEIICVSDRKSCNNDFLSQIEKVAQAGITKLILRDKESTEKEYLDLAQKVIPICEKNGVELILHSFLNAATKLSYDKIHTPFTSFLAYYDTINKFELKGTSVHNVKDAMLAKKFGADYIVVGHIYETDCKKGLQPRGQKFLKEICGAVPDIPVYAIGGINPDNAKECFESGAKGVCIMSGFMKSEKPIEIVEKIKL